MMYKKEVITTGVGAGLALIGGLLGFIGFPLIVKSQIEERLKLEEGSDNFERWKDIHIPIVCKLYFFNVTNADDAQNGAKPIVEEIGPYVYNQYRKRIDVTQTDDILSYHQYQYYEFDEEASAPLTETDNITVVNLALMAMAQIAEEYTGASRLALAILEPYFQMIFGNPSSVFLTTTPQDFLFDGVYLNCNSTGLIHTIICNIMESFAPSMLPRLEDGRFRFSLFGFKNGTRGDYLSMNGGTKDIDQLGEIVAWENMSTIGIWPKNETCNKISGSDGVFPPFQTQSPVLNFFNTDTCRTVITNYDQNVKISGIEAYRYLLDENTFASPSNYSDNQCYCLNRTKGITGDDGCLLDGVMEMWGCIGAPVVISWPHFYNANEAYRNGVIGLRPNKSLHTTFLALEPISGSVLQASKKAQVNIFIRPINSLSVTANLATKLMPILWMDESFALNDENVDLLHLLHTILDIFSAVQWCLLITGLVLLVFGWIWLLSMRSVRELPRFTKLLSLNDPY